MGFEDEMELSGFPAGSWPTPIGGPGLILLVADAVVVEPVSTPQFPANREKNRDFFGSGLSSGSNAPVSPMMLGA